MVTPRKGRKGLEIAEMFGLTLGDQNSRLRLGVKYNRLGRKVERTESLQGLGHQAHTH